MLPGVYHPDDHFGVKHDILVDSRMEVDNAQYVLQEIYVQLDSLADDDNGIWNDRHRNLLRTCQTDVETMLDHLENMEADIGAELDLLEE